MGLGEKFGRWDDRSVIFRADDPEKRVAWARLISLVAVTGAVSGLALAVARRVGSKDLAYIVLFVGSCVYLIAYVFWRRRRNRALTGSPTTWPSDDKGA